MNKQIMLTQGKGGIILRLISVFQSRFFRASLGEEFFLELTQPNVNTGYNRNNKKGRG